MHIEVERYAERYAEHAKRGVTYRKELGKAEKLFLENVWGPVFDYRFDGLQAEYPFKDFKGGDRFIDFVYMKEGMKLLVEIDGFTTHARDFSPAEFNDHLMRQNDLILAGWLVLRFSAYQVEKRPELCQKQLMQAIGYLWAVSDYNMRAVGKESLWNARRQAVLRLAHHQGGDVNSGDVAKAFGVNRRTALKWLQRMASHGDLEAIRPHIRIVGFRIAPHKKGRGKR